MENAKTPINKTDDSPEPAPGTAAVLSPRRELKAIVAKANAGDRQALCELREKLNNNPAIWQRVGDLGAHAELALIGMIAGADHLLAESIKRKLGELRAELTGSGLVSTLERLGIDRVVTCWLETQYLDLVANNRGGTVTSGKYWRTAQDQAHRRYLSAMRSLVTIRQLAPAAPRLAETG